LLRVASNDLCLACHSPAGQDASASEFPDALRGHVPADESRFEGAPRVQLGANGLGHPVLKHPVSGPSNPRLKERPFECSSCHRPHAASTENLLFAPAGWVFCSQCHRN
jgi:predicted CXXCH cytochrome family protein